MGLLISSLCPSNDIANRSLPFILMVQFIFSGQLFELGDTLDKISKFTISKWGMDLLGSIGNITDLTITIPVEDSIYDTFKFSAEHVINLWAILILFILIFSILSILSAWIPRAASMENPRNKASFCRLSTSGNVSPVSHLLTVCLATPMTSANCS